MVTAIQRMKEDHIAIPEVIESMQAMCSPIIALVYLTKRSYPGKKVHNRYFGKTAR